MDKKVWAIVGIIALHLALILFFRGTLKPEEMAQAGKTSHPDVSPIEPNPYLVPTILEEPASHPTAPAGQTVAQAVKKPDRIATVASRFKTRRNQPPLSERTFQPIQDRTAAVTPPVFQDTIIWVKTSDVRPIYLADRKAVTERTEAAPVARIAPIKKKRSFFKKAVPVLRKPYDWIKTLVSKL
jgi:hypothetical protein